MWKQYDEPGAGDLVYRVVRVLDNLAIDIAVGKLAAGRVADTLREVADYFWSDWVNRVGVKR